MGPSVRHASGPRTGDTLPSWTSCVASPRPWAWCSSPRSSAEFLLGNLPITLLGALVLLAPMYGGGALLIREVTRRAGRGVPTMLVLGIAYGLLEEGIATQSLFNAHYAGQDLLHPGYVPWLGIGVPWTLFVLTLHAVGSTTVPIVMVELCTPERRTTPWLRRPGLIVAAALFVVGLGGERRLPAGHRPVRGRARAVGRRGRPRGPRGAGRAAAAAALGRAGRGARRVGRRAGRAGGGCADRGGTLRLGRAPR